MLPNELFELIFSFLDYSDFTKVIFAGKNIYMMLKNTPLITFYRTGEVLPGANIIHTIKTLYYHCDTTNYRSGLMKQILKIVNNEDYLQMIQLVVPIADVENIPHVFIVDIIERENHEVLDYLHHHAKTMQLTLRLGFCRLLKLFPKRPEEQ